MSLVQSPQQYFPLSNGQRLLLAGQRLQSGEPLYNMVFAFRIAGEVAPERFGKAFDELVGQCEVLRTVLVESDSEPVLMLSASAAGTHSYHDLSVADDPEQALADWLDRRKAVDFRLSEATFDSALLKMADDDYLWYFNQHHLLTDAWSVSLIFRKLQDCYLHEAAAGCQQSDRLPSAHSEPALGSGVGPSAVNRHAAQYWDEKLRLSGKVGRFYREVPSDAGGRTRRMPHSLCAERNAALRRLIAAPEFASINPDLASMQVFATVLLALLHRLSAREALAIGVPSHSRTTAQLRASAGMLINVLPLHVAVEPGSSFIELYARVARANQELLMYAGPELATARASRSFDVLLNYIPTSFGDFAGMPVTTEWVHSGYGDSNHLLRLQVHDFDRSGAFTLLFDVNEQALVGEEADWVIDQFLILFDAMMADPEQALDTCPLLPSGQSALPELLPQEKAAQTRPLAAATVVDLFLVSCRQRGERDALVCETTHCSYHELDRRSHELAARLVAAGYGTGQIIAVLLPRSVDLVVAALAVMRSGAALLPLDPGYPQGRNEYMLKDSGAALLLTANGVAEHFLWPAARTLCRGDDWPLPAATETPRWQSLAQPMQGAYVIYTSGSTGKPKGVLVGHQALGNYIQWATAYYLDRQAHHFPLFTSVCFDLTLTSLFTPLACGGTLHIYPEPTEPGEITVRKVIEDDAVDVIKLTPAHLGLIRHMDLSRSGVKKLIVGGEDLKVELASTITEYLGGAVEIYNEYGPTETTVGCAVHRYDPQQDCALSVPIGRPIDHAHCYILDRGGNPVPRGVTGELYIGGRGVAEGYLNRPELTAERFLEDPVVPGEKMYRSGDLARWSHQGYLEYLGRADQQVKIRGVRIETGEVEAALLALAPVSAAVVDVMTPEFTGAEEADRRCTRCGIESRHPAAQLDNNNLCRLCRVYERNQVHAGAYFRPEAELRERIAAVRSQSAGPQDSLMLLSGGKDSSYALCRLVDLGLTPLVFTLDNGYISEGAMDNVRRLVDTLGLELIVGSSPVMDSIFVESLTRHSNVCNGCFKTIYTLSMQVARERGISTICTGLSRGQIFETRVAHLFQQGIYDPAEIDRRIVDARKAYHRVDDVIARNMDVSLFQQDAVFEEIDFLDFYRYTEVTLDEIYAYLHTRAPWIRPTDTGRSTNCLINDAGIHVHKMERGYHNYALPYSWDVRLGHKLREAAVDELEDEIDTARVDRMLREIGYTPRKPALHAEPEKQLVAYYVAADELPASVLREQLVRDLPGEFIPRHFVRLPALPLTANGKVDRQALPRPQLSRQELAVRYAAPLNESEALLVDIWQRMLAIEEIGIDDSFFELGGDSIINVQIVAAARDAGISITPQQLFDNPTVRELAAVATPVLAQSLDRSAVTGEVPLLPALRRYLETAPAAPDRFCQSVVLRCAPGLDADLLQRALNCVIEHHDVLRSAFSCRDGQWRQQLLPPGEVITNIRRLEFTAADGSRSRFIDAELEQMRRRLDLERGATVAASWLRDTASDSAELLLVVNHLVIDGVSWWMLLEDLETACRSLAASQAVSLPGKTLSVAEWATALADCVVPGRSPEREFWLADPTPSASIPCAGDPLADNTLDSVATVQRVLDRTTTQRLIREVPANFGVQIQDLLVTALLRTLLPETGNQCLALEMEGHGRQSPRGGPEPLRTVGWLTSFYPVSLQLPMGVDAGAQLRSIRQQLQAVPHGGVGYGALRYGLADGASERELATRSLPQVLFNYLGQWDLSLGDSANFSFERPIRAHAEGDDLRRHLFEINAVIFDGALSVDWSFSQKLHSAGQCEALADTFMRHLVDLVVWCAESEDGPVLTPADFPAAALDQQELNSILDDFGE